MAIKMATRALRAKLSSSLRRFSACQKGTTAVIFAVAAVPFFACAGGAIDFVHFSAAKNKVQIALDAGALAAAAPDLNSDAERVAAGLATFNLNMQDGAGSNLVHSANFTITDGKVVADASVNVPTHFMGILGVAEMAADAIAEVGIAGEKNAEIALVLDYSGSMNDKINGVVKYKAMKQAATDLVNDLSTAAPDKVKFGLVPFSHHVYTTMDKSFIVGGGSGTWTGCTQDRKYPANTTAATPTASNSTKWGQPQAPVHIAEGCSGYTANNLKVVPLSNDFTNVKNRLSIMTPYAWTHIALGVEFGYHLLSPNAPYAEGAAFNDDETKKFMVVLTDGMQTEPGFGPGSARTVAQGEKNLETLCSNAKADGITIITMAFDLDDSDTRQRLQNCASDPDKYFFVADDTADLAGAFEAVKAAVVAQVYLSK
jgi:Flp pilus assembly protein TadG